ncbi:MAG: sirohydrochlorin chelatase [Propionibacteriaceae bacterium]
MSAPSVILLGYGSPDPRVSEVTHQVRAGLQELRPNLDVHVACLNHSRPSVNTVVGKLARKRVEEAVLVPLLLSDAFKARVEVPAAVAQAKAAHPSVRLLASRPIGPEASLLSIVDQRLREALRARQVTELDGLVLSAAGSSDVRSNALIARRARQWASHHRLPCLTAFTSHGMSAGEAVASLQAQGRRHIAVGSWFLTPGQLFARQAEQAYATGAVAVAGPLGAEEPIARIALDRYLVAAIDLVDVGPAPAEVEDAPVRHLSVVGA